MTAELLYTIIILLSFLNLTATVFGFILLYGTPLPLLQFSVRKDPVEEKLLERAKDLIEEWTDHQRKRTTTIERDENSEFVLTIRRPLDKPDAAPPITNAVSE